MEDVEAPIIGPGKQLAQLLLLVASQLDPVARELTRTVPREGICVRELIPQPRDLGHGVLGGLGAGRRAATGSGGAGGGRIAGVVGATGGGTGGGGVFVSVVGRRVVVLLGAEGAEVDFLLFVWNSEGLFAFKFVYKVNF